MSNVTINAGPYVFSGQLELSKAPKTCARFVELLPFSNKVVHSRWSGEAVWVPLGEFETGLDFENHTCYPSRGDILLYPGGFSETEILLAYGSCQFASKMGQLAGNHFISITDGIENLEPFGQLVLLKGAQDFSITVEH